MDDSTDHVDEDVAFSIQKEVHAIADKWMARGHCPNCVVINILIGAGVVARDTTEWTEVDTVKAAALPFTAKPEPVHDVSH